MMCLWIYAGRSCVGMRMRRELEMREAGKHRHSAVSTVLMTVGDGGAEETIVIDARFYEANRTSSVLVVEIACAVCLTLKSDIALCEGRVRRAYCNRLWP